jgi:tungstate transport system substrate-binding protein
MKKIALLCVLAACATPEKGGRTVRLATTTSVVDSGLLAKLIPPFEKAQGVKVEVASVGSGEAFARLRRGEADAAIVHTDEPWSGRRTPVFRNDYVMVGPRDAAAVVAGAGDALDVVRRLAASDRPFVSRADDSGTERRERELFAKAGVNAKRRVEAKAGMAATLARTDEEDGFTLTDRATFVAKRKSLDLAIVYQDDPALENPYYVLEKEDASLSRYLTSEEARARIGAFGVAEHGESLFTPSPRP